MFAGETSLNHAAMADGSYQQQLMRLLLAVNERRFLQLWPVKLSRPRKLATISVATSGYKTETPVFKINILVIVCARAQV